MWPVGRCRVAGSRCGERAEMTRNLQCRSRHSAPHRWLGAAILVLLLAAPPMARSAQAGALETANVMVPLDMRFNDQARNDFRRQLQTAKAIGIRAVAVVGRRRGERRQPVGLVLLRLSLRRC